MPKPRVDPPKTSQGDGLRPRVSEPGQTPVSAPLVFIVQLLARQAAAEAQESAKDYEPSQTKGTTA